MLTVPFFGFSFATPVLAIASVFGSGRMKTAREGLEDLLNNPRPIVITTGRKTYVDFVMTRLSIPNNAGTGLKFDFNATVEPLLFF